MPKHSTMADQIRQLAKQLSDLHGGSTTFLELQQAVATMWFGGDLEKVREDYLLTTLMGHGRSQLVFAISGNAITVTTAMPQGRTPRLSPDELVYALIAVLPWSVYKTTIHTVNSGFNKAFRSYFPEIDPVAQTTAMHKAGKLWLKPVHGGVLIGREKPDKAPSGEELLALVYDVVYQP